MKSSTVDMEQQFLSKTILEQEVFNEGFSIIAGVDEVGRGPLVGPVVAACVILPPNYELPGLDDSKKLSEKKRDKYYVSVLVEERMYVRNFRELIMS